MKTTACSDVADYVWLTGDEAGALLVELADADRPLHSLVAKLRGRLSSQRTHLLLEQVELRRRAAAKFTHAARMFFTRLGLEQATDEWVAAYKASRFTDQRAGASPPPPAIADLCCGIGGDLSALAKQGAAIGVDLSPIAAHFAAINAGTPVETIDVADCNLKDVSAWHIDPDRRPSGRRTTSIDFSQPNLATIEQMLARVPHAAVKLAPATKLPVHWTERCELEWISRDRECRQLVAWHGALAQTPGLRRATVLPAARGLAPRTITGAPNQPIPIVCAVDRYVFDINAAVLVAHLKGVLAAERSLSALAAGSTYLTGPQPIDDAALACFEVADVLPLEPRKLARHLAQCGIGQLEIKKRGVEIEPEKLRRQLKPRGDNAATLLITHVDGQRAAILAQRVS
ncbi:MAG: class I SAM-dependent methyltransferase [Planctomycetes bacterium]|nr:class I SAM-dependent methyltransferase [Planctomycetota bacterium]